MAAVTVGAGTSTINTSGNDSVAFLGTGTLDITGTAQNPITVTLSSVGGVGLLDTINITYADVTLGGTAGVSAIVNYNIGTGGTLRLQSTIGIALGSKITFTATPSHLVVNSGVNLNQLSNISIAGFGPGSNIDLAGTGFSSYTYADNAGTGTGGTLTLLDASGNTLGSIVLTTGEFTAASFNVHSDGGGGTLVDFATYVSSISATPANADLTVGGTVALQLGTTGPVTITGGTPTLTLNDGGTATYDAAHSTATNLVFDYTVQPGQNTPDLTIAGINLNGASATDALGSPVSLSGGLGNPAGVLQIDTTAPTITAVSTTPGSGAYAAGHVITINLTPSEAVTVTGGTPTLTLNDGGTATYDAAHSTSTNLVFDYTVQSGQNTPDLTVTGSNLNGATITDGAGNAANLAGAIANPPGILQIETSPPTITSVSTTPNSGSYAAGQVVAINLTPSVAVTVAGGTPTLMLNDGGTATYDAAHSTATNLVFDYTVQSGQNTPDLTVTGANLNGATISDAAGNTGSLAGAVGNPPGILQIDTTPPTITSISTTPGSGSLAAGQVVAINLTPSEAVTVAGGTPTLTLNDGGTATYDAAHSTSTNLVFDYTVQSGQNTPDLTITGSSLNGATITDAAGNAANLAGAVGNPPGILQIDTTPPTITSISTTPGSGSLAAGQVVVINLTPSEAVTVAGGTPTLTLNDGGTATYDAINSTATKLVFDYTVQSGDNTADLTITGSALNGATITDAAGNPANLAGAVGNPPGTLQIDTTPPTITSISTTPGSGSLAAGQVVAINLTPSEAVTVAGGTPTLTLNDGGTATYDPNSSTATNLVFKYTVQSGQNTPDLTVTGSNLNGATIADAAGNTANLAGAVGNPPGTLQIDTTAPTIISVTTTPGSGSLAAGQIVAINVMPSEAVTVAGGTPTLTLNDGGTAIYDAAHSTSTNLVFDYTVQSGQNTADLTVTVSNLNGATITDAAGNTANLAGAVGNPPGTLQIDTTAPTITSISTTPNSGSVAAGQVVAINLTPSEAVAVAGGTPTLTLNDGGTATYDPGNSTATNLVFKYVVQPGDNTADLTITGSALNGATITDPAGNPANLAGAVGNPPGILQVDTTRPAVTSVYGVTTTPGSGDLAAGGNVALQVSLTGTATVTGGTPTLTLSDGGTATYDASSSTATSLIFRHTVQPGQNTADLTVTAVSLNGATAVDVSGNAVDLSGAVTNPAGILQIDTTAPTITSISTTPGSGSIAAGQVVAINLTPSEAVTVAGGTPTLTLNDGGTATYSASNSSATNLVFNYTVQSGQNTSDLSITASNLNGATIADGAGNAANLAGAVGNPPGTLQIDTTTPTITSVSTTPGSGSLAAGQVVAINLAPSEAVTVAGGTPTLTLNDGGTATYDLNSSTATNLVFKYTVQSGQNTPDLTVTGSNLNGATIADAAGNAASLAGAVSNPPGTLQVDTIAPTITSVSTTPSSGSLATGQVVSITLTPSEAVAVAGGTPTLTLNDGGTASYDPSSSTATSLVFKYTVQSGQNTSDLTVTGSNLNGATITDPAGNPANLAGAVGNPPGTLQIETTPPTITSISTTPGSGALAAGQVVAINLTPSAAVTVAGGTPTLTLNDGGIATYDPNGSTAANLVFKYTVQPGQNTPDLTVTGSNLNGATITDAAGNATSLAGAVGNPPGVLQIDTMTPTITSISTMPGSGTVAAGQVVAINLTPSEAVAVVGGTPTLTLNDGGTATYDPNSSTATNIVFKYVVQPGDNTNDLTITGSALNGATIADPAGNPANLAGAIGNPPGILQVDTTRPAVTSVYGVTTTPGSGDLAAGGTVALQVSLTGNATVTGGTPTLTLNDGGTATYDASSSTSTSLIFRYTVLAGQNTADLAVTAISLNGATVVDGSNNPADLSGAVTNPGGILQVDTTAPTIGTVTTTPGSGSLGAGQIVAINIGTSEAVTVSGGTPTLTLNDGGTATYDPTNSTGTNLVFKYTVQPGQNTADLTITGSNLNGGRIADGAGNALDLSRSVGNPPGTLQIDTTAPTVIAVATQPNSGTVEEGQVVAINVTPSEAVTVSGGTPTLTLNDGGIAIYDAADSTPTLLIFQYTAQPGQNTSDLTITGSNFNGASITDPAGNSLILSGATGNPPGILPVDTAPIVTSVVVTPANGDLKAGGTVVFDVNMSVPITLTSGTPTLALSDGGTATYDAASSTSTTLVFRHTVQAGQNTPDLSVAGAFLNGAVITDATGNTGSLAGAIGNPAGILQIDTIAPTDLSVVFSGSLEPGGVLKITANISEAVTVVGGPFMYQLANGGVAIYDPLLSTPTMLVSTYTIPVGDQVTTDDVAVVGYNENGASATDGAGNALDVPSIQKALLAAQGNFSDVDTTAAPPTTIDVYRFFETTNGTHFYTADPTERATIIATRPDLVPEGVGLTAINPASSDPNAAPVYRFFDLVHGTQFLTASLTERDNVIATRRDLVYEPSSVFYEHTTQQAGDTAVYRFFDSTSGTHFYTASPNERATILQTRPDLVQEGVGFYEPARNPVT